MNDAPFRKIVTPWMASEAYRRLRSDTGDTEAENDGNQVAGTE